MDTGTEKSSISRRDALKALGSVAAAFAFPQASIHAFETLINMPADLTLSQVEAITARAHEILSQTSWLWFRFRATEDFKYLIMDRSLNRPAQFQEMTFLDEQQLANFSLFKSRIFEAEPAEILQAAEILKTDGITLDALQQFKAALQNPLLKRHLMTDHHQWMENAEQYKTFFNFMRQKGRVISKIASQSGDAELQYSAKKLFDEDYTSQALRNITEYETDFRDFEQVWANHFQPIINREISFVDASIRILSGTVETSKQDKNVGQKDGDQTQKKEPYYSDDTLTAFTRMKQLQKRGQLKSQPFGDKLEETRIRHAQTEGKWPAK